ncbi:MAG TPA: hypothetical protein VKZ63_06205 [Kofleriaceae bacterium]|nr:hypothetical protein [Kofleriaceae bacterium]
MGRGKLLFCSLLIVSAGCRSEGEEPPASAGASRGQPVAPEPAAPRCDDPVPVFEDGAETGRVCPEAAGELGLTVIDLSDDWVPRLFRGDPATGEIDHPYRDTYVALANYELGDGPEWDRARDDIYLEVYGIVPSFRLLARRLHDERRYTCHALVDSSPIAAVRVREIDVFRPARSPIDRWARGALDARMVCEGLLKPRKGKRPRWRLQAALEAFQRKHTIVSRGMLDRESRRTLLEDPRELDFRALLRALRARVVDATGLIEDGSARGERGRVLGRRIDGDAFQVARYQEIEEGAPDLVSPATEAAARALGWTDPRAAAAFFRARGEGATAHLRVAVRLPPPPDYHRPHMELRAEIDRGDVWYETPRRRGRIERRPTLTLWARRPDGSELALIRWHTTIGGWQKEAVGRRGRVVLKYKNSDVGRRVWRDLIAAPAWLPPPTTPGRTLVRRGDGGKWLPDTDLVGPGYASAYGLVALIHHRPVTRRGVTRWYDNGIRTHGSVSYASILRGESHGCHRLFNQSAVQLASFLLQHRAHQRHGLDDRPFIKRVAYEGKVYELPIPNRGYRYELTPPVEVEVLKGRIRGKKRRIPTRVLYVRR